MQQNQTKIFTDIGALSTMLKDENFDADKVWNKLEHRLTKKKSRKIYWIWLAASMLILINIPAFYKEKNIIKNVVATKIVLPKKIEVVNTEKQIIVSKKTTKNNVEKHTEKQQTLILDTLQNIVENTKPILVDTIEVIKKAVVSISTIKVKPKKLKVVYASDLYEENNQQVTQKEFAKEQPKKSFFKLFESQNKETEETTTTENQPQPNKTFLGFKSRPTAAISINENQ